MDPPSCVSVRLCANDLAAVVVAAKGAKQSQPQLTSIPQAMQPQRQQQQYP